MQPYEADIQAILSHRHDNGADFWATPDGRLIKGSPFTTLESACMLFELGMPLSDPVLAEVVNLIFSSLRKDGRFQLLPGGIYPCQTIGAFRALCTLGYAEDPRLNRRFDTCWKFSIPTAAGAATSSASGAGRKRSFLTPGLR